MVFCSSALLTFEAKKSLAKGGSICPRGDGYHNAFYLLLKLFDLFFGVRACSGGSLLHPLQLQVKFADEFA